MAFTSLNQLSALRAVAGLARRRWLKWRHGLVTGERASISMSARLLSARRGDIEIGPATLVAFKTLLYTRDSVSGACRPIRIGARCFIGGGSTITPGVTIGDEVIVAAGSVVFDNVPSRVIVAGNPARILRHGIEVGDFGRLKGADANSPGWHIRR